MQLERIKPVKKARIGLYAIGLHHYWGQFEGLLERLIRYNDFIAGELGQWGDVHNFGMVDTETKAQEAGEFFNARNVDILFCFASTYSTSGSHIAVPQLCRRPVIVLNLQPVERMNYEKTGTGEWLAHCCACCVPEVSNAFARAGIPFHVVSGLLGLRKQPEGSIVNEMTTHLPDAVNAWREIGEWARAASAVRTLKTGRMGFLGHTYPGMLDMYSDFTMVTAQTGLHVEVMELCDLAMLVKDVTVRERKDKMAEVEAMFTISEDSPSDPLAKRPTDEQLQWACTVAVAQERLVREFDLDALTYYYRGRENNEYEQIQSGFILGHSLLTGRGIPCSGEGDMKTAIAMKICDTLDVGGSFCEIVATDFADQAIIMGHDGPFHIGIAAQKPVLRGLGLYHGKEGSGVSVEAKVKTGPITNLGITQTIDGKLKMISNQGMTTDGPTLMIGNTMTPVKFAKDPSPFMNEWFAMGPTHHFAMSIGHNTGLFRKVAVLMNIPLESVC